MNTNTRAVRSLSKPQRLLRNSIVEETVKKNINKKGAEILALVNAKMNERKLPTIAITTVYTTRLQLMGERRKPVVDKVKEELRSKGISTIHLTNKLLTVLKEANISEFTVLTDDKSPVHIRMEK